MVSVEPRRLLDKLSPTCLRALEAASATCVSMQHYEVAVEHYLLALLESADTDFRVVIDQTGVDLEGLHADLLRSMQTLPAGNTGRPVFSALLLEWIQDAWLYCSVELQLGRVRSLGLLVRLVAAAGRYLAVPFRQLDEISRDDLRIKGLQLASASAEAGQVLESEPLAAGVAGSRPRGDSALDRFTNDLTQDAREGRIDPVLGRDDEIRQMTEILLRRRKNNPIIVGEAGVGKTAVVEGFALKIAQGEVPAALSNVRVLSLDLGALQAGAGVRGEFESRLKGVIDGVKSSPVPIILFIDEAHTLIGAGGAQGSGDAANLLKPALARGELRTIAATTYAEFKKYFEKDAALERRFQPVRVNEPDTESAVAMLRGLAPTLESVHGVRVLDEAVRAAVELSTRYISGRQLPDKAVDLLDSSAAFVRLLQAEVPPQIQRLRSRLSVVERELAAHAADSDSGVAPAEGVVERAEQQKGELTAELAELETKLAAQRGLVDKLRGARALDPKEEERRQRLLAAVEAIAQLPSEERLVAADVDASVVARMVSHWTGIPVGRMMKDDASAILSIETSLRERVQGQDAALGAIAQELRSARSGLKSPGAPLGVFLLVGPSGVGKTETALTLADLLFGGERFITTVNMSEFQERHTVSRLIGSPPGYVGYGEGGVLTEAVRHRPYSVVLLDEVEKADRDVMNLFYQVFDKGMLADGEGRVIDFKNTVVLLTSNLGTDVLMDAYEQGITSPAELTERIRPILSAHFKPALLARMTVVPYQALGAVTLRAIVERKLEGLVNRLAQAHGAALTLDDTVASAIVARCTDIDSGARNVEHIMRSHVVPVVASHVLRAMAAGDQAKNATLSYRADTGSFVCEEQ